MYCVVMKRLLICICFETDQLFSVIQISNYPRMTANLLEGKWWFFSSLFALMNPAVVHTFWLKSYRKVTVKVLTQQKWVNSSPSLKLGLVSFPSGKETSFFPEINALIHKYVRKILPLML